MISRIALTLVAAGTITVAGAISFASIGSAQSGADTVTNFSAQLGDGGKKVGGGGGGGGAPKVGGGAPRNFGGGGGGGAPKNFGGGGGAPKNFVPRGGTGGQKFVNPNVGKPRFGDGGSKFANPGGGTPRFQGTGPRFSNRFAVQGRNFSAWHNNGNYRRRHGNGWATFVALSALGAIALGGATYYPYAYLDAPADYCNGFTEDGCSLRWQAVPTLEGFTDYQCVAYCPWQ